MDEEAAKTMNIDNPTYEDGEAKKGPDSSMAVFDKSYSSAPSSLDYSSLSSIPDNSASIPFVSSRSSSGYASAGSAMTNVISSSALAQDDAERQASRQGISTPASVPFTQDELATMEKGGLVASVAGALLSIAASKRQWALWSNLRHPPHVALVYDDEGKEVQVLTKGKGGKSTRLPVIREDQKEQINHKMLEMPKPSEVTTMEGDEEIPAEEELEVVPSQGGAPKPEGLTGKEAGSEADLAYEAVTGAAGGGGSGERTPAESPAESDVPLDTEEQEAAADRELLLQEKRDQVDGLKSQVRQAEKELRHMRH